MRSLHLCERKVHKWGPNGTRQPARWAEFIADVGVWVSHDQDEPGLAAPTGPRTAHTTSESERRKAKI